MNKKLFSLTSAALLFASSALPAFAVSNSKATGSVGYTAYGLQRNATFNAQEKNNNCTTAWSVTGNYQITFKLANDNTPYTHHASFTQTGNSVSGDGGYPVSGGDVYHWNVTSGHVSGDTLTLTVDYDLGAPNTTMHMTGTIAPDGTISGDWSDNFGGSRSGTWSTTSGTATEVYGSGCAGKGDFNYIDANNQWYVVDVQYVNVSGNKTWFAGPVIAGNVGAGQWLFAEVVDNGQPGVNHDQIYGSFTTEAQAKNGVALMSNPGDGPFTITSGNLLVH